MKRGIVKNTMLWLQWFFDVTRRKQLKSGKGGKKNMSLSHVQT